MLYLLEWRFIIRILTKEGVTYMSFDGFFTRAMTEELSATLTGGRITKIHQPYKNELLLVIRAGRTNHKLLLSAHPSYARVQLTEENTDNPSEAPMFCMLLRKHLEGYFIEKIEQPELERIIKFEIRGRNEIGDITQKLLIIEIMGKHSNIILVDKERNMIIDCIKHVPPALNSYRTLLPGHSYVLPPAQNKINPLSDIDKGLTHIDYFAGRIDKQLVTQFAGISPLLAKEITYRAGLVNRETVPESFNTIMEQLKSHNYQPTLVTGDKEAFYLIPLQHLKGDQKEFPSLSLLLDRFYYQKADRDRVKQQAHDLERILSNEKEKNEKKLIKLEETLQDSERAEIFKKYGELITGHIYALNKGMKSAEVIDYYDENQPTLLIELDVRKTPSENAQWYFSKYQKAKNAKSFVIDQIEKTNEEIQYLDNLIHQMNTASPRDLQEIREELEEGGYVKKRYTKKQGKKKDLKPVLDSYLSSDGIEILVGKNNKQNEYLTNRLAAKNQLWFHTKDIPGSHVVIRDANPTEQTIKEAAILAAYFSKARQSSQVPVDSTLIRHVKKPAGAKPGFVTYDNQTTYYVTPDEEVVLSLKA